MFNQNLTKTSVGQEVKETAKLLEDVKTTIRQQYPNIVVNLKVQRKGIKTTINAYGSGIEQMVRAFCDTHDLLEKNGLPTYPLTKPTLQSKVHAQ
jgi:hypothetical protein